MDYTDLILMHSKTINETPYLLSLLYDVKLLPEQITDMKQAIYMAAIVEAYKEGSKNEL